MFSIGSINTNYNDDNTQQSSRYLQPRPTTEAEKIDAAQAVFHKKIMFYRTTLQPIVEEKLAIGRSHHKYLQGRKAEEYNLSQSIPYYKEAADAGVLPAQSLLGEIYEQYGQYDESIKYYEMCVKQGFINKALRITTFYPSYLENQDALNEARMKYWSQVQPLGHAGPYYEVGLYYYFIAEKTTANRIQAFNHFKYIYDQFNDPKPYPEMVRTSIAHAIFLLGEMYYNGDGISKDLIKAKACYESAAKDQKLDAIIALEKLNQEMKNANQTRVSKVSAKVLATLQQMSRKTTSNHVPDQPRKCGASDPQSQQNASTSDSLPGQSKVYVNNDLKPKPELQRSQSFQDLRAAYAAKRELKRTQSLRDLSVNQPTEKPVAKTAAEKRTSTLNKVRDKFKSFGKENQQRDVKDKKLPIKKAPKRAEKVVTESNTLSEMSTEKSHEGKQKQEYKKWNNAWSYCGGNISNLNLTENIVSSTLTELRDNKKIELREGEKKNTISATKIGDQNIHLTTHMHGDWTNKDNDIRDFANFVLNVMQ